MDTPNVPVDCASCARLREQVATLAHQSAGLREDAARARESERNANESCIRVLTQTRRGWVRRERLARWAGVVAADVRESATEATMLECLNLTGAELERAEYERDSLQFAYNDAVRDLARSWRSA